jgi:monoterpene epsilon-lactone hydrolase
MPLNSSIPTPPSVNPSISVHPLSSSDSVSVAALRSMVAPMKGKLEGPACRGLFAGIMEQVKPPVAVTFEPDTIGDISGWWAKPPEAAEGSAILHLHGGWFNWGTALAYRNLVGHIASSAGVNAFIPDYRLAPEHPFPAAINDAEACYHGLISRRLSKIALTGDSAGGNLALVLLSVLAAHSSKGGVAPAGAVVLSPVTDLDLSGESYQSRAGIDPYFTKAQVTKLVRSYLGESDSKNPLASPLYGDLTGLPPIRLHVGDDEVLLDDSRRYWERAVAVGVDARLDIWTGMPHGFINGVSRFEAASLALHGIGAFLSERLERTVIDK